MKNLNNFGYVGTLHIGNPPQKVRTLFDTGSTNSWVLSDLACIRISKKMMAREGGYYCYEPLRSKTFHIDEHDKRYEAAVEFGSGKLDGFFVHDKCTIGDPKSPENKLVLNDFNFGLVEHQNAFQDFDALVGLAYKSIGIKGKMPFFDSLMAQNVLEKPLFAFFMSRNTNEQSDLTLGYYDTSKF